MHLLVRQIRDFPPEFLLFVEHVSELVLQNDNQGETRTFSLRREDNLLVLDDGGSTTRWMFTKATHKLSPGAKSDSRSLDDAGEVPISWAAPIDRLNEPGKFWAFFPTMTTSLLSGILNAPWKTNEDRQNLLLGVYNSELIDAAATMVAAALPKLSNMEDPARHLDALPRREERGDSEHSSRLRDHLNSNLLDCEVVPDQSGELQKLLNVRYPPREITDAGQTTSALERWAAYKRRPLNWSHHRTLTRNRLAALERIQPLLLRVTIAEWLEALVDNAIAESEVIKASMAAIQTAALIPEAVRRYDDLGRIVLTADGSRVTPDPE